MSLRSEAPTDHCAFVAEALLDRQQSASARCLPITDAAKNQHLHLLVSNVSAVADQTDRVVALVRRPVAVRISEFGAVVLR